MALGSSQLCHIGALVITLGVMRPDLRAINITTGDFLGFNQFLTSGEPVNFYKGHNFVMFVSFSYFAYINILRSNNKLTKISVMTRLS